MSTAWSGRVVAEARRVMAHQLPTPCGQCGETVNVDDQWNVGHIKSRATYPELTLDPRNWRIEHRTCSNRSGQSVVIEKAKRDALREHGITESVQFFPSPTPPQSPPRPSSHTGTDLNSSLVGKTTPRLFSAPRNQLATDADTAGYECIRWVESNLGLTLLDWQKWFLIHALELNPDGTFRYRTVLLLVSRQNGKTTVIEALTSWFMATRDEQMILGTSTNTELAREPWSRVADHMDMLGLATSIKRGALDTSIRLANHSRYKVAAASRRGGRSLSVDLLVLDELREMLDEWDAYNALSGTTTAKPNALTLALSNAGDWRSVVLNGLRTSALDDADDTLGIFEWSAPEDAEIDDPDATAQANPALGHTITPAVLNSKRKTMPPEGYRTEHLCQWVASVEPGARITTPEEWDELTTSVPDGAPAHAAIESYFSEGCTLALAWADGTVDVSSHPDLATAAAAAPAGVPLTVGASLVGDPAFKNRKLHKGVGRGAQAVLDLSRAVNDKTIKHTGSQHLTDQVLGVRTKPATDGISLISKTRTDALKAAMWAHEKARRPGKGAIRIITSSE